MEEAVSASTGGNAVGVKNAKVCAQILNAAYDHQTALVVAGETPPGCEPLTGDEELHPVEYANAD